MGFYEAGDNSEIGLDGELIDECRNATAGCAELR